MFGIEKGKGKAENQAQRVDNAQEEIASIEKIIAEQKAILNEELQSLSLENRKKAEEILADAEQAKKELEALVIKDPTIISKVLTLANQSWDFIKPYLKKVGSKVAKSYTNFRDRNKIDFDSMRGAERDQEMRKNLFQSLSKKLKKKTKLKRSDYKDLQDYASRVLESFSPDIVSKFFVGGRLDSIETGYLADDLIERHSQALNERNKDSFKEQRAVKSGKLVDGLQSAFMSTRSVDQAQKSELFAFAEAYINTWNIDRFDEFLHSNNRLKKKEVKKLGQTLIKNFKEGNRAEDFTSGFEGRVDEKIVELQDELAQFYLRSKFARNGELDDLYDYEERFLNKLSDNQILSHFDQNTGELDFDRVKKLAQYVMQRFDGHMDQKAQESVYSEKQIEVLLGAIQLDVGEVLAQESINDPHVIEEIMVEFDAMTDEEIIAYFPEKGSAIPNLEYVEDYVYDFLDEKQQARDRKKEFMVPDEGKTDNSETKNSGYLDKKAIEDKQRREYEEKLGKTEELIKNTINSQKDIILDGKDLNPFTLFSLRRNEKVKAFIDTFHGEENVVIEDVAGYGTVLGLVVKSDKISSLVDPDGGKFLDYVKDRIRVLNIQSEAASAVLESESLQELPPSDLGGVLVQISNINDQPSDAVSVDSDDDSTNEGETTNDNLGNDTFDTQEISLEKDNEKDNDGFVSIYDKLANPDLKTENVRNETVGTPENIRLFASEIAGELNAILSLYETDKGRFEVDSKDLLESPKYKLILESMLDEGVARNFSQNNTQFKKLLGQIFEEGLSKTTTKDKNIIFDRIKGGVSQSSKIGAQLGQLLRKNDLSAENYGEILTETNREQSTPGGLVKYQSKDISESSVGEEVNLQLSDLELKDVIDSSNLESVENKPGELVRYDKAQDTEASEKEEGSIDNVIYEKNRENIENVLDETLDFKGYKMYEEGNLDIEKQLLDFLDNYDDETKQNNETMKFVIKEIFLPTLTGNTAIEFLISLDKEGIRANQHIITQYEELKKMGVVFADHEASILKLLRDRKYSSIASNQLGSLLIKMHQNDPSYVSDVPEDDYISEIEDNNFSDDGVKETREASPEILKSEVDTKLEDLDYLNRKHKQIDETVEIITLLSKNLNEVSIDDLPEKQNNIIVLVDGELLLQLENMRGDIDDISKENTLDANILDRYYDATASLENQSEALLEALRDKEIQELQDIKDIQELAQKIGEKFEQLDEVLQELKDGVEETESDSTEDNELSIENNVTYKKLYENENIIPLKLKYEGNNLLLQAENLSEQGYFYSDQHKAETIKEMFNEYTSTYEETPESAFVEDVESGEVEEVLNYLRVIVISNAAFASINHADEKKAEKIGQLILKDCGSFLFENSKHQDTINLLQTKQYSQVAKADFELLIEDINSAKHYPTTRAGETPAQPTSGEPSSEINSEQDEDPDAKKSESYIYSKDMLKGLKLKIEEMKLFKPLSIDSSFVKTRNFEYKEEGVMVINVKGTDYYVPQYLIHDKSNLKIVKGFEKYNDKPLPAFDMSHLLMEDQSGLNKKEVSNIFYLGSSNDYVITIKEKTFQISALTGPLKINPYQSNIKFSFYQ